MDYEKCTLEDILAEIARLEAKEPLFFEEKDIQRRLEEAYAALYERETHWAV